MNTSFQTPIKTKMNVIHNFNIYNYGLRQIAYNNLVWLTDGIFLLDDNYVARKGVRIDKKDRHGWNYSSHIISPVIKSFGEIFSDFSPITEIERLSLNQMTLTVICFKNDKNTNKFYINAKYYAWFAYMNRVHNYQLYALNENTPIYLLNYTHKMITGCVMPMILEPTKTT